MKIPPYWARARYEGRDHAGKSHTFVASGWSFTSLEEARSEAMVRARRIFDHILGNGGELERYAYHDRPMREEILKEIKDESGDSVAVVTRNRYGAEVLNCGRVLFVDVDFPKPGKRGLFESLMAFFRGGKTESPDEERVRRTVEDIEAWARNHPDESFRLYRTKEGLRLLFTGRFYEPLSEETERILKELKSDPLYVMLTRKQECFRARLTAKPWRCGSPTPPSSFPWENDREEREYRAWETVYRKKDGEFSVCEFLGEFGKRPVSGALRMVVDFHDRATRVQERAPLA